MYELALKIREHIDYNVPLEDRTNIANKAFNNHSILNDISNYFFLDKLDVDNPKRKLFDPHLGTHSEMKDAKFTSDHDLVCKAIQGWATYLIGQADNVYPPERELEKQNYKVIPKKRDNFKSRKFKVGYREGLFDESVSFPSNQHTSKFPAFLQIDRSESREEAEHKMSILISELQVLKKELEDKKKHGTFSLPDAKLYKDINEIAMEIMHSKHRFINMRMLLKPSTVIDFEQDTGYVDENGNYKHISYNAITFSDPKHIAGFITEYKHIKHFSDDIGHPLYYHMEIFHYLFNGIVNKLNDEERNILEWHMLDELKANSEDKNETTICSMHRLKFGREISPSYVSKLLNKKVPEMIAQKYKSDLEEYVYTYKVKGVYHTCSQCKKPKLATQKYFGKDCRNKSGLKSICRICIKDKK